MSYQEDRFAEIANAIREKDGTTEAIKATDFATRILEIPSGGGVPPTAGGMFTGATIPLTYKDNTHEYENVYNYSSAYAITISGLEGRATITGNGTNNVSVAFDVSSSTSSLKNFIITLESDEQTLTYKGLHAHYGTTVTGILTLAYTNITKDGSEGTIGTNYKFIETDSTTLPTFSLNTTLWNTIYSYQVLNVLIANYSSTSIGDNFLNYCYAFNQPLTIPSSVTSIGNNFLNACSSFNQPLTIPSSVTSIESTFLYNCSSFNQPLTIPSSVTSIGTYFLSDCYSFNQPLTIASSVTSIGNYFLQNCRSFNQSLTIPSSVTSIGNYFLNTCYSLSTIIYNAAVYPTDSNSLTQNANTKTSTSGAGIIIYGSQRANLITALPDRTSSPYRKLINGGS